eukprot:241629_1
MNDEIWLIANQKYTPSTTSRSNCFTVSKAVKIYGGFIGSESSINERPINNQHKSIISGDINILRNKTDNCYHVLTYTQQLTIDNIIISDGYANHEEYSNQMYTLNKYYISNTN